jgi:hypothetical protein
MIRASIWTAALGMFSLVSAAPAAAQDMMRHSMFRFCSMAR